MSDNYLDLLAGEEQTGDERDRQAMLDAREMLIAIKGIPGTQVLQLALYASLEHALPRSAEALVEEARDLLAQAGRTSCPRGRVRGRQVSAERVTRRRSVEGVTHSREERR